MVPAARHDLARHSLARIFETRMSAFHHAGLLASAPRFGLGTPKLKVSYSDQLSYAEMSGSRCRIRTYNAWVKAK